MSKCEILHDGDKYRLIITNSKNKQYTVKVDSVLLDPKLILSGTDTSDYKNVGCKICNNVKKKYL